MMKLPPTLALFAIAFTLAGTAVAAPHFPTIAEAEASLAANDLDGVYLAFGAVRAGQHPEGDAKVSTLLVHGAALAARNNDWALVAGFAGKARQLVPGNVEACLAEADAAIALKNRAEGEEALEAALKAAPNNWAIVLRRARYAHEEGEDDLARELLERIPADGAEHGAAKQLLAELDAALARATSERARQADLSTQPSAKPGKNAQRTAQPPEVSSDEPGAEEAIPGYAARTSRHFRITYSEGQRDFAQKAGYEQQCLDLFERAYARVHQTLGQGTAHSTEVVLYTAKEFEFHFGGRFGNGLLGFYAGKIRMNRADTIDDSFFDTAVHEYTHAVIDSMAAGGRVPSWVHEGTARWVERTSAGGEPVDSRERRYLQRVQSSDQLPPLAQLADHSFAELGGPMIPIAYAKSALAIDLVTRSGSGITGLERAIRGTRTGVTFEEAFAAEFGKSRLAALDGEVARSLE